MLFLRMREKNKSQIKQKLAKMKVKFLYTCVSRGICSDFPSTAQFFKS